MSTFRSPESRITDAQLQALLAVAEYGSFTHAARRLGLTQSAVSHALTSLEQLLDTTLVERAPQGARLTPAGERIVRHSREILRLKVQIKRDADAARRFQSGELRVGSFGASASRRLLPPMLDAFAARYPNVSTLVLEGSDEEVETWLREGAIDAAFVNLPRDEFDTVAIATDTMHAIIPSTHPSATQPRLPASRLAEHPFIMSNGGCERMIRAAVGDTKLDVRYRIRDLDTIIAMVARGTGVAALPRLALPDLAPDGVIFVPLDTDQVRHVGLAVRSQEGAGSPARALLRIAARRSHETPSRM